MPICVVTVVTFVRRAQESAERTPHRGGDGLPRCIRAGAASGISRACLISPVRTEAFAMRGPGHVLDPEVVVVHRAGRAAGAVRRRDTNPSVLTPRPLVAQLRRGREPAEWRGREVLDALAKTDPGSEPSSSRARSVEANTWRRRRAGNSPVTSGCGPAQALRQLGRQLADRARRARRDVERARSRVAGASSASRFARATSATWTKSRSWPPSSKTAAPARPRARCGRCSRRRRTGVSRGIRGP